MPTHDDPFSTDADRTVILPTPGGRSAAPPPPTPSAPSSGPDGDPIPTGLNPLVAAANPLLNLVPQLKATAQIANPAALRDQLTRGIRAFEARARENGAPSEQIIAARYALCTVLDEVAAGTPWGRSGAWANQSLLVTFHNETWGGEKFFQLLAKLADNPSAHVDLLELFYVCLGLGFEGRFRVRDNGLAELHQLRERLAQLIRRQRGEPERELSVHWQPAKTEGNRLLSVLPLWVLAAGCAVVLLGVYFTLLFLLNRTSDPVSRDIYALRTAVVAPPTSAPAPTAPQAPRLAGFLAPEIQQGLVIVRDESTQSVVTIVGDRLFASGSTTISAAYEALIARIAQAIAGVPGRVVVTGHTDSSPIMSVRYPSNWHLSQERANSVLRSLAQYGAPSARLRGEGRGDGEPVASNETAEGRARNRRVEVTLFAEQSSVAPSPK